MITLASAVAIAARDYPYQRLGRKSRCPPGDGGGAASDRVAGGFLAAMKPAGESVAVVDAGPARRRAGELGDFQRDHSGDHELGAAQRLADAEPPLFIPVNRYGAAYFWPAGR